MSAGSGADRPRGDEEAAVDALFARYLRALERDRMDEGERARVLADFVVRAGPLAGKFLERARFVERLARMGESDADARRPRRPDRIGRYEVLAEIGSGGAARVLRANDPLLQREVVLKWIPRDATADSRYHEYLGNDARALARLSHPSIVRVIDVDSDDAHDFIVMEYVRGASLAKILRSLGARSRGGSCLPGPLSPELEAAVERLSDIRARVRLVERLAEALALCHASGVVHRDIKPSNVLVRPDGEPVLIDFGIAHFAGSEGGVTENLVGTPGYLAPEQVASSRTGASPVSDVFSLGVVLFELLTLTQPFERATRELTLAAVMLAEVPPMRDLAPTVSRDLARICLHALERDPRDRYPSMAQFAADLRAARELRPLSLPEPSLFGLAWRHVRRLRRQRRRIVAACAVAGAVGIAVLAGERWVRSDAIAELVATAERQCDEGVEGLSKAGRSLLDAERHLRALERDVLGRAAARRSAHALAAARERFSEVLAERIAADVAAHSNRGTAILWSAWRDLLALDERINPTSVVNLADRQRGKWFAPADIGEARLELHLLSPRGGVSTGRLPVAFGGVLEPGLYRVTELDAGATPRRQVEFRVDARERDSHARRIALPDVAPGFHDDAVFVSARTIRVPEPVPRDIELAPTWISRDVVRVRDLVPWIVATRPVGLAQILDIHDLDAPAVLSWEQAVTYAQWRGVRLPTALEWYSGALTEGFRFPDDTGLMAEHRGGIAVEFLSGAPEPEMRTARHVDLPRFRGLVHDEHATDPNRWTGVSLGRTDGAALRMPTTVRTAVANHPDRVISDLAPQAYRSGAFRLATNVPPRPADLARP